MCLHCPTTSTKEIPISHKPCRSQTNFWFHPTPSENPRKPEVFVDLQTFCRFRETSNTKLAMYGALSILQPQHPDHQYFAFPHHHIGNSLRFYFFFCAFIPETSSRSAGGVSVSMRICIFCFHAYLYFFFFYKGKGLRDYNISKSIFSHYLKQQPIVS